MEPMSTDYPDPPTLPTPDEREAEFTVLPLEEADPDLLGGPGWVATGHQSGTVTRTKFVTDVDGDPLGVDRWRADVVVVNSVPPGSIRLERLEQERLDGVAYDEHAEVIAP